MNAKIIQFQEPNQAERINLGLFGPRHEWDPDNVVRVESITNLEKLKKEGLVFTEQPLVSQNGLSTFIRSSSDLNTYLPIASYAERVVDNKEDALILVLQKLGVCEYWVKTEWVAKAGVGSQKEVSANGKIGVKGVGGSAEYNSKRAVGFDAGIHNFRAKYREYESLPVTIDSWNEAKECAIANNIYDEIRDILEGRRPGSNQLQCSVVKKKLATEISLNFNIAQHLTACVGLSSVFSANGGFNRMFNLEAELNHEYETEIVMNFNPKMKYEEYLSRVRTDS